MEGGKDGTLPTGNTVFAWGFLLGRFPLLGYFCGFLKQKHRRCEGHHALRVATCVMLFKFGIILDNIT